MSITISSAGCSELSKSISLSHLYHLRLRVFMLQCTLLLLQLNYQVTNLAVQLLQHTPTSNYARSLTDATLITTIKLRLHLYYKLKQL